MTNMNSDFSDMRFGSTDGLVEYPYWIESISGNIAKVWVKIPNIPANTSTQLAVYYDNDFANSASNGDLVFEFFDGFSGSVLDDSKWTEGTGVSISNGILIFANSEWIGLNSLNPFGVNHSVRAKLLTGHSGNMGSVYLREWFGFYDIPLVQMAGFGQFTNVSGYNSGRASWRNMLNGNNYYATMTGWSANTWNIYEARRTPSFARGSINDANFVDVYNYYSTNPLRVRFELRLSAALMKADWVLVRKYNVVEPSYTIGLEMSN